MVKTNSFFFPSVDGIHQCFACEWHPEGPPRAVVQLVHGLSEYVERYDRFARFLAGHGFLVCGHDHLGHGKTAQSDGVYGFFAEEDGWDKAVRDMEQFRQLQAAKYPGIPYFLFGHSMGSFLTRTHLIRYPGTETGAILSGTGQEPRTAVRVGRALAQGLIRAGKGSQVHPLILSLSLGAYNRKFRPNHTEVDWISRSEKTRNAYLADPLCRTTLTPGLFRDMMDGLLVIGDPRQVARMDKATPILIFSGDRDPVGQMGKGVVRVYDSLRGVGCKDVTLRLYRGGRHEMLNELNYEQVQKDILLWLERYL